MPNWVTFHLSVEAENSEKLNEFITFMEEADEAGNINPFSFNSLIPMPESVASVISGSYSIAGYAAWYGDANEVLGFPWVAKHNINTAEELQNFLEKQGPDYKIQADLAKKAMDETGYIDWYQWSVAKWGTKWNASSAERELITDNSVDYYFMTAWSFPEPVIKALAARFPDLNFRGSFSEESSEFEGDFEYTRNSLLSIEYRDCQSEDDEWYDDDDGDEPQPGDSNGGRPVDLVEDDVAVSAGIDMADDGNEWF